MAAYVDAGAAEAWIVYPQSRRIEFFSAEGAQETTSVAVDLKGLFDWYVDSSG